MVSVRKTAILAAAFLLIFSMLSALASDWGSSGWETGTSSGDWIISESNTQNWNSGIVGDWSTEGSGSTQNSGWITDSGSEGNQSFGGWGDDSASAETEELGDRSIPLVFPILICALMGAGAVFAYAKRRNA